MPTQVGDGDVAQLGEHLNGIEGADGSIPFISTPPSLSRRRRERVGVRVPALQTTSDFVKSVLDGSPLTFTINASSLTLSGRGWASYTPGGYGADALDGASGE